MSEKVKLPKDVADAIERLREKGWGYFKIIGEVYNVTDSLVSTDAGIIHYYFGKGYKFDPNVFIEALVNGYEVELTPKEQAIQYLIKKNESGEHYSEHDVVTGIMKILGVKENG